ncbi:MAG: hypothetical protein ACK4KW_15010 [Gemmobacter sp.]
MRQVEESSSTVAMLQGLQQHNVSDWRPDLIWALIMPGGVPGILLSGRDLRTCIARREIRRYGE